MLSAHLFSYMHNRQTLLYFMHSCCSHCCFTIAEMNSALIDQYLQLHRQYLQQLADTHQLQLLNTEMVGHIQALMSTINDLLHTDGPVAAAGGVTPRSKRPRTEPGGTAAAGTPIASQYPTAAGTVSTVASPGGFGGFSQGTYDASLLIGSPGTVLGFGGSQGLPEAAPTAAAAGGGGGGGGRGNRGFGRQGSGKQNKGKPQMSPQQEAATRLLAQMQRKMVALSAAANAAGGAALGPGAGEQWGGGGGFGPADARLNLRGSGTLQAGQGLGDVGVGLFDREAGAAGLGARRAGGVGTDASQGEAAAAAAAETQGSEGVGGGVGTRQRSGIQQQGAVGGEGDAVVSGGGPAAPDTKLLSQVGRAVYVPEGKELRPRKKEAAQLALQVMLGGKKKK